MPIAMTTPSMSSSSHKPAAAALGTGLPLALGDDSRALAGALDELLGCGATSAAQTLLRLALLQPGRTMLWYQKLLNRWDDLGRPPLKPNPVTRRIAVLSDHTIDNLAPLVTALSAGLGVHVDVQVTAFDSVEAHALDPTSALHRQPADFVLIALGETWLHRQLGPGGLVASERIEQAADMLDRLVGPIVEHAEVLITNFAPGAVAVPGGYAHGEDRIGYAASLGRLNAHLHAMQSPRVTVIDRAHAVHAAGGQRAYSAANEQRAGIPYDAACLVTLAREVAFSVAALCGKTHRALVLDLDNTLWGGTVGDAGPHGIVSGPDDADGRGYHRLQLYCRNLTSLGVALAVASKNSPEVRSIFERNPNLALGSDDFSSMQIGWDPKSSSIANISSDLGFGPEFMLFVDDNLFELAEALGRHPHLDVIRAGPAAADTLAALAAGRYFHTVRITDTDLSRHRHLAARRAAAELRTSFDDYDDYLAAIRIRVDVQPYGEPNRRRVAQMLQKSNQFNLTTRRHTEHDLDMLRKQGAVIGVFSYEDVFGSQGVIAAVVLVPNGGQLRIDSWVMSCRVLNRTVEQAIAAWMMQRAGTRPLRGEFIATVKNGIVADLYARLGFRRVLADSSGDHEWWECDPTADTPPTHLVELRTDSWDQHDGQEHNRRDRDRRLPDAVPPARARAA